MAENKLNLSTLGNVTIVTCSLKYSENYQSIFNLVKKGINIEGMEDENESQKFDKCSYSEVKKGYSRSTYDESTLKSSPNRRKSLLKREIRGCWLKKGYLKRQKNEHLNNFARRRTLGAVKPGRSYWRCPRIDRYCIPQFCETSLVLDNRKIDKVELTNKNFENGGITERNDGMGVSVIEQMSFVIKGDGEAQKSACKEETTQFIEQTKESRRLVTNLEKPNSAEKISLLRPDNSIFLQMHDKDFVESSQDGTNSHLKKQLLNNPKESRDKSMVNENMTAGDEKIDLVESEAKIENTAQTLSPEWKSQGTNVYQETSIISLTPVRRKAGTFRPFERSTPKQQNLDTQKESNLQSLQINESEITETSQSNCFNLGVKDHESRITNMDRDGSSRDMQTELFDRTSFALETTELSKGNQDARNDTSSKTYSSSSMEITEESWNNLDILSDRKAHIENPLCFGTHNAVVVPSVSVRNVNLEADGKEDDKSSRIVKKPVEPDRCSTHERLKEIEISLNIPPSSSESQQSSSIGTRKEGETNHSDKLELFTGKTLLHMENSVTSEIQSEETTERELKKSIIKTMKLEENKARRRSACSRVAFSPELENQEKLAAQVAIISKKIQKAKQTSSLSEKTVKKLQRLVINLRHQVLPQHEIESRAGTKALSYKQHKAFLRLAPLNRGVYTHAEDQKIKSNWNAFCRDHNWKPKEYKPFLNLKHGDKLIMASLKERRKFVQFLADGLPNRPLNSVYSRFKNIYGKKPTSGRKYTRKDDMKIIAYMSHKPERHLNQKCSELAKVLNRTRESIWKRLKKLEQNHRNENDKKALTKVEWNLSVVEKFIATFLDVTLSEDVMELKGAFIPKAVWLKMEEKMKIDHQLMKRFWEQQLHLQLFTGGPLYLNRIKIKLIEHIYANQMWHPKEIKWRNIVKDFDGLTIPFLRKVFNHLTMRASLQLHTRDLKCILKWLHEKKINQLMTESKDKCLPRIFYINRKAKLLEEIEETQLDLENYEIND